MAKLRRYPEENRAYFVTTAVAGRQALFADRRMAAALLQVIEECRARYGFLLLAYAIMPDHLHLVAVPHRRNTISDVVRYVKGTFARRYNASTGAAGSVWQSRFYDTAIRSERELRETITYVESNPVQAGMVNDAARYEFSSANPVFRSDMEKYYEGSAAIRPG